jgi:asparagine synthase (glutamine-hydrolysing)
MERFLPKQIPYRSKHGYSFPIKHWLRNGLKGFMLDSLSDSPILKELFNISYVNGLIDVHLHATQNHSRLSWTLLIWLRGTDAVCRMRSQ